MILQPCCWYGTTPRTFTSVRGEEIYFDHLFEDCISGKGADELACNEAELAFLLCDGLPAPTTVSAGLS